MKYTFFFVIILGLASCKGSKNVAQSSAQQQPQQPNYTNQTTVAAPSEQQIIWTDVNNLDQGVWDKLTELWGIQRGDGMWIYPLSEGEKSQFEVVKHLDPEKAIPLIASWKKEVRKDEHLPANVTMNANTPYGNAGISTGNGQNYPAQGGGGVYTGQQTGVGGCYVAIGGGAPFWFNGDPTLTYPGGSWQAFTLPTGQRGTCWYCTNMPVAQTGFKSGTNLFGCK